MNNKKHYLEHLLKERCHSLSIDYGWSQVEQYQDIATLTTDIALDLLNHVAETFSEIAENEELFNDIVAGLNSVIREQVEKHWHYMFSEIGKEARENSFSSVVSAWLTEAVWGHINVSEED